MTAPAPADWLVEGTVVTMDSERRVIRDGAVAIAGGSVVAVGEAAELRSRYAPERTAGSPGHFVLPGLVDCHNHLAQVLVREYGWHDLPNIHRIYRAAERVLDADDARVSAGIAIAQMLRAGITTVAETTSTASHEQAIAETVIGAGIRCAMARGQGDRTSRLASAYEQVDERSWFRDDPGRLEEDVAVTEEFLRDLSARGEGRVRPWVHNRGVTSCSEERFLRTAELARRHGTGVMTHINRDREEVELSVSLFGCRPIEHLARIGALDERLVAIHAMLTTEREIRLLADAGAKVAHAPIVCGDLLSNVTRVPAMRAAGVTVGLGCDTVVNDLFQVMRAAALLHAACSGIPLYDPLALSAQDALAAATIDAARVLLWEDEIGSLEPGKAADVVLVDGNNLRLSPAYDPVATLVRHAVGGDVESVWVAGRIVVENRRLLTLDEAELLEAAPAVGRKLGEELNPRRYWPLEV